MHKHAPALAADQDNVLPDYQFDPEAYEREQAARPDEQFLYGVSAKWARDILDASEEKLAILDLCCGTGLSMRQIFPHANIRRVVGVDNCQPYLKFAAHRFETYRHRPELVEADAVDGPIPEDRWSIIMMISAYHHIEDERKLRFLARVRELIRHGGYAIIGENVLPGYVTGNRDSYCSAVRAFYDRVEDEVHCQGKEIDPQVLLTIERVAKYGFDGEYEYKVKYDIMKNHFEESGLVVVREQRVWPKKPIGESGGNYVMLVRGATREELQERRPGAYSF